MKKTIYARQAGSSVILRTAVTCAFVFADWAGTAAAAKDFTAECQTALAEETATFYRVLEVGKEDPAIAKYGDGAGLVDELVGLLVERLSPHKTRAAGGDNVRSTDLEANPHKKGIEADVSKNDVFDGLVPSMLDILETYCKRFAELLKPKDDRSRMLGDYIDAKLSLAAEYVAQLGGETVAAGNKPLGEVTSWCLIIPFIRTSDLEWSIGHIKALPDWMKKRKVLIHAERSALAHYRPLTAYWFAYFRERTGEGGDNVKQLDWETYFTRSAHKVMMSGNLAPGIHCLKAGITFFERVKDQDAAARMRLRLAAELNDMGQPRLAAKEMRVILGDEEAEREWARAAVLRLNYLYRAGDLKMIVEEAQRYRKDPRAKPCLPQLYYFEWVTCRRLNDKESAIRVQEQFLAQHSDHPLAANMYFASGMEALAAGDYHQAEALLKDIEIRYPTSEIVTKTRQIRQRLENWKEPKKTRDDQR